MLDKTIGVLCRTISTRDFKKGFLIFLLINTSVPQIEVHTIDTTAFKINDIHFLPIRAMHKDLPVLGFRIADFTYITDANFIADSELEKIKGTEKVLVLNALRREKDYSHFFIRSN